MDRGSQSMSKLHKSCRSPPKAQAEIYALLAEDDRPTREESEAAGYDDAGDPSPVPRRSLGAHLGAVSSQCGYVCCRAEVSEEGGAAPA